MSRARPLGEPRCETAKPVGGSNVVAAHLWVEGADGKWTARKTPTRSVEEIVRARTSPAVKSALKSLLEAPVQGGAAKKTTRGKANA